MPRLALPTVASVTRVTNEAKEDHKVVRHAEKTPSYLTKRPIYA